MSDQVVDLVKEEVVLKASSAQCHRIQRFCLCVQPKQVDLVNVYGPSGNKMGNDRFILKYVLPMAEAMGNRRIMLMGGDWNITPGEGERWSNFGHTRNGDAQRAVRTVVQSRRLVDVHWVLNPECTKHTHTKIERPQDGGAV